MNIFKRVLCNRAHRQFSNYIAESRIIPHSKGLPILGTLLSIAAAGGASNLHVYIHERHKEYGKIFREKLGPVSGVFISDGNYIRKVFAEEGKYPKHMVPESWLLYNEKYGCKRGIFFMDGEEWAKFRKPLNNLMLKHQDDNFIKASSIAARNIVKKWRGEKHINDLEQQLYKWSLEVITAILMGSQAYIEHRDKVIQSIENLALIVYQVFLESAGLSLLPARLAKNLDLPVWRRFSDAVRATMEAGNDLLRLLMTDRGKYTDSCGLLHKIRDSGAQQKDLERIVMDLILAAGDTTSHTMQWVLHILSVNQNIQKSLYEELCNLEEKNAVDSSLLRGVLKETLRLYPVAPFLNRYMPEDVDIDGYRIKAGELIVMSLYSSGRDEQFFQDPLTFSPHRWIRSSTGYNSKINLNASLPFAIGRRSCLGRKIAEIQILVTLFHILKNFLLTSEDDVPVNIKLRLISVPEKPISLILKTRT